MIYGSCRTNLDEAKRWTWPTMFLEVPQIGDRVRAAEPNGLYTNLRVCGRTFYTAKHYTEYGSLRDDRGNRYDLRPEVEIELNK